MILYPTIELKDGRCVSLNRGRIEEPHVWHVDPVKTALEFAAAGASWLQITDFDAVEGGAGNEDLVSEIIRAVGIPVQLAGGMRSRDRVETWIDRGAARIVLGTLATIDPQSLRALAKYHPDQIVLAVDIWRGQVMADGWRNATAFAPEDYIAAFAGDPLAAIIVTDIDSEIEDSDATLGLITGLARLSRTPVIAGGVVRTLDDLARLKYVRNVAGAIVGRALFRKNFTLAEALDVAETGAEPVAGFL